VPTSTRSKLLRGFRKYYRGDDPETRVWPRLSRFYGLTPSELELMPRSLTRVYAEELPFLLAEEHLLRLEASAYPHMEEDDQKQTVKRWQKRLERGDESVEAPPPGELPARESLAGIGIKLVEEAA
jgi:hypothetical protein